VLSGTTYDSVNIEVCSTCNFIKMIFNLPTLSVQYCVFEFCTVFFYSTAPHKILQSYRGSVSFNKVYDQVSLGTVDIIRNMY